MGNTLLDALHKWAFSEVVLAELLAALRNLTRVPAKVSLIAKTQLGAVVSLAVQPPSERVFTMAAQCIRNFAKVPDYERHIKQTGGHDIVLVLSGDAVNKFNFKK